MACVHVCIRTLNTVVMYRRYMRNDDDKYMLDTSATNGENHKRTGSCHLLKKER